MKTQEMHRQLMFFLSGFLIGVLYIYIMGYLQGGDPDFLSINNLLQIVYMDMDYKEYFLFLVKKRAGVLLSMVLTSLALPGRILLTGFLMLFGCSVGSMLSVLIMRYGLRGIFLFLALIFPQDTVYIPVLFGWIKLLTEFNNQLFHRQGLYGYGIANHRFWGNGALLFGVTIIGLILECYVNPLIVIWCVKLF